MDLSDPTTYKEPDSFVVLDGASKKKSLVRIAPEITSYSWKIYEHPGIGIAL